MKYEPAVPMDLGVLVKVVAVLADALQLCQDGLHQGKENMVLRLRHREHFMSKFTLMQFWSKGEIILLTCPFLQCLVTVADCRSKK